MKKYLNLLNKDELLSIVDNFEHYPAVSKEDDEAYIIAYLVDEACSISQDEMYNYIVDNNLGNIKETTEYKISVSECRCNNCMTYFESDDDLIVLDDDGEKYKGCPECKTDGYLFDLTN